MSPEQMSYVIELYGRKSWLRIRKIYADANVSPDPLLECCSLENVIIWTRYAVENGLIYEQ